MDTTPPPGPEQPAYPPAPGPQRSGGDSFFDAIRRTGIIRTQDRWIGGVAGGLAQRLGVDPLLIRGIFAVTALFGGAGFLVYGLAWALLPEQADGRIHLQETIRGRFDAALLGAIAFFIVGISRGGGLSTWGIYNSFGWLSGLLWLAAIVTLVALVISAANQRRHAPGAPPRAPWTGPGDPAAHGMPRAPAAPAAPSGYAAPYGAYPPVAGGYASPPVGYVPPAPVPPRPLKPHVHGPGAPAVGVVVGLTLLALAVLLVLERAGTLDWPVALTVAGIGIILSGLGIVIAGLRGRSSGTLGFLAIVAVVLAVPIAAIGPYHAWSGASRSSRVLVSDGAWTPTTAEQARKGMTVALGTVKVDLTKLDLTEPDFTTGPVGDRTVQVPISLGAGDLTVTVPRDTAVAGDIRLDAGDISWQVDQTQQFSGLSGSHRYHFNSDEVAEGASPALVLQIEAGAASVRVVEGN